jgi:uncharacterized membrane-anchored protein YhcB (DUF1043 family)
MSAVLLAVMIGWPVVRPSDPGGAVVRAAGSQAQGAGQGMQMGMSMQDMMKMHEKMMADMKASQTKLDDLAQRMTAATGEAKINAMAELLNELVRSHRTMDDHMSTMHEHMMKMGRKPRVHSPHDAQKEPRTRRAWLDRRPNCPTTRSRPSDGAVLRL